MTSISWGTVTAGLQHAVLRRRDGGELIMEFPCGERTGRVVATRANCSLRVPLQARPFTTWPHWMPVCHQEFCLKHYAEFLVSSPSLVSSPKCQAELQRVEAKLQLMSFDPGLAGKMRASRLGLQALERSLVDVSPLHVCDGEYKGASA